MSCITEILKLKGDKDFFMPEENWIAVEGGGIYMDYEYLIVLNSNGHRCGYVALPHEHEYNNLDCDYFSLDINCHGGLTFMSSEHGLKDLLPIKCNDIWIGFDCGHYSDKCDVKAFTKYYGEKQAEERTSFFASLDLIMGDMKSIKDFHYAEKECKSIIEQLIKI